MPVRPFQFCLPVRATVVSSGPDWLHEIKHDGYRGRVIRDGDVAQIRSKAGLDLTHRYSLIVEAARKMKIKQFVIDGEICVLDVRGISQFDWLHSGEYNDDAQLYAFDIIALDGDDLRPLQLDQRKTKLAKLLK